VQCACMMRMSLKASALLWFIACRTQKVLVCRTRQVLQHSCTVPTTYDPEAKPVTFDQRCSRGGNAVPKNIFGGMPFPQMISGQGEQWYSSVPPGRLAKKCKVYEIETDKRYGRMQMLEMTTTGSHADAGSRAIGEVRHCHVNVFLWQLFPTGRLSTHQSSSSSS